MVGIGAIAFPRLARYAAGLTVATSAPASWLPGWPSLEQACQSKGLSHALPTLQRAYQLAARAHASQKREDGSAYIHHPTRVTIDLINGFGVRDPDLLAAALLHDVVEDTPVTLRQLQAQFGSKVAGLVDWASKPARAPGQSREERDRIFLEGLRDRAPDQVLMLKLADRLDNTTDLATMPEPKKTRYRAQTAEFYLPWAERLSPSAHQLLSQRLQDSALNAVA
ncbi:MAG: bifunctional (p)ppGpp synthetase/guanosine-3',5'-bis(diphosphate) 3'-pyrophosphohydrolase [Candidatus Eremiobacteraeota bacterium]|nr:bifunctional (p)ppGpp synthetase/guanosine-3',5'-bis(diphosphate) 3'-pyrophosphohydrolase [Candidatus Eremiobacteraeota bacterium]